MVEKLRPVPANEFVPCFVPDRRPSRIKKGAKYTGFPSEFSTAALLTSTLHQLQIVVLDPSLMTNYHAVSLA